MEWHRVLKAHEQAKDRMEARNDFLAHIHGYSKTRRRR